MNKLFLLIVTILSAQFLCAGNLSHQSTALTHALKCATKAITYYKSHADKKSITRFYNYLIYYKAEGGYQAVTPAPYELRDSLTKEERKLFNKLKKYARPLRQKKSAMPGASSLSPEGEIYFSEILKMLKI